MVLILSLSKNEGHGQNRMGAFVYMFRCHDGRYYVGTTRGSLEQRLAEHNAGKFGGFTSSRTPVKLVFQQEFQFITDAIAAERQIKGWRRAKKEALIAGDWKRISALARNYTEHPRRRSPHPSTGSG